MRFLLLAAWLGVIARECEKRGECWSCAIWIRSKWTVAHCIFSQLKLQEFLQFLKVAIDIFSIFSFSRWLERMATILIVRSICRKGQAGERWSVIWTVFFLCCAHCNLRHNVVGFTHMHGTRGMDRVRNRFLIDIHTRLLVSKWTGSIKYMSRLLSTLRIVLLALAVAVKNSHLFSPSLNRHLINSKYSQTLST